ncbi:MAG TPA: permease prefix domain 1-containing protein [Thermoanaerobaculia bacterium]|jgi:hypothetical protein|nr:permease prefix domain 1-containing protein [Thermoanaerobaculia bacterium]
MFNLEREVATWSAVVHEGRCRTTSEIVELSDHLYCEIDRARGEGLSDEEAFRTAIARMGPAPQLAQEHAKNRSWLRGTVCRVLADDARQEHRAPLIAHSMIWAALLFATTLILNGQGAADAWGWFSIGVFVPLWWVSDQLLRSVLRQRSTR